jgi:replicative DNA helicase
MHALSPQDESRVIELYRRLRDSGLLILTDASGMDCEELGHRIATSRAKVCAVDYMQLVKAIEAKGKSREQEVGQISRALKRAAKRGKKVVIAAAQINRDNKENRRRPVIADLRESGAIEQDMDVGIFLHLNTNDQSVDSYITEHDVMGNDVLPVEWIVAKNRSGRLKIITMMFDKRYQRFGGREQYRHEPRQTNF